MLEVSRMRLSRREFAVAAIKLRIVLAEGSRFQELAEDILALRYGTRFRKVQPLGPHGDGGNDGYVPDEGLYLQIYSPLNPTQRAHDAVKKAESDLGSLRASWGLFKQIRRYWFVFNDKFRGENLPLERAVAALRALHGLEEARTVLSTDLLEWATELSDRQICALAAVPIPEDLDDPPLDAIGEVLDRICQLPEGVGDSPMVAPDFDEKIAFNGLDGGEAARILRRGQEEISKIERVFKGEHAGLRESCRSRLRAAYIELQQREDDPERIFLELRERVLPVVRAASAGWAANIVLAYFFEACDIYKEPVNAPSV